MDEPDLTRRRVLGLITATGSAGALAGTGTVALFSDEETFTNNRIEASVSTAGVVDVEVDGQVSGGGSEVSYRVTLPDERNNNPSYVWVRTARCPTPIALARETTVELRERCNGETRTVDSGSLLEVLDRLRDGRLLCEWNEPCLQPGDDRILEIVVTDVGSGYDGSDETPEFTLEFYGEQCRYDAGAENPFGSAEVIDSCDGDPQWTPKGISFAAFCPVDGSLSCDDITLAVTATKEGGEPTAIRWEASEPIETVVLKAGYGMETFDAGGDEKGTAAVGDGSSATGRSPPSPCPDGDGVKFEYSEGSGTFECEGER